LERLTVAEAAKRLELTQEAVRQRIRRGTIEYEKDTDGKTYVYLTADEADTNTVPNAVVNGYITALKSQIESLQQDKEALERDKEHMREESIRKDHIIMSLTQRIPAIEAPQTDAEDVAEPRESTVSDSGTDPKGDVPQESADKQIKQSWWQRLFGT